VCVWNVFSYSEGRTQKAYVLEARKYSDLGRMK
jgi:hypothetical protein